MSYERSKRRKKFEYQADRDTLQRGISVMINLLTWQIWLLIALVSITFSGLLGMVFYLLTIGMVR